MKKYFVIFVVAAVALACTLVSVHLSVRPGPASLAYDEATSCYTGIGLVWDAQPLIDAGAQSFTLELVKDRHEEKGAIGKTVGVGEPVRMGVCLFAGLPQYERYYARIKANYEGGKSSGWTYARSPIEVGVGEVGRIESLLPPEARVVRATAGTVSVEWSMTGFEEGVLDLTRKARAGIYADAACTQLLVSWDLSTDFFDTSCKGGRYGGRYLERQPAFIFTGLEPSHKYWVRIDDITMDSVVKGKPLPVTTAASCCVMVGQAKAAQGEYVLREDFDELLWGGSMLDNAAGYSFEGRGTADSFIPARGVMGDASEGYFPVTENIEIGLFSTMKALIPTTRLSHWGYMGGTCAAMSGAVKIGGSRNPGKLVTPALTNLGGAATLELSFDGEPYYIREPRTVQVLVLRDAVLGSGNLVSANQSLVAATLELEGGYRMHHYTVTLPDVRPGDRIALGGAPVEGTDTCLRLLLDNLSLKVLHYESL